MADELERILDECIDRIGRGESPEKCLGDYPEHAKKLEPLLRAMTQTKAAYSFVPSADAKRTARLRFYAALEKQRQPSLWERVIAHRLVWATLASIMVVTMIGYVTLRSTVFSPGAPPAAELPIVNIPGPSAAGNFVFLVSDEVNAIADFSHLSVTIEKVGLLQGGGTERWVEFVPEVKEFDLTLLPGEKTQELWRGNVPEGDYSKVIIYVTGVRGTLKATGETLEIKLPSDKLQLSKTFQVSAGNITSFTYDITVVKAGNGQGGGKYLLKPQVSESSAIQVPDESKPMGKDKNPR